MNGVAALDGLNEQQLREFAARLMEEVRHKQATIDKLTHEMAIIKRLKFAARSEAFSAEQRMLLEEALDTDLQALADEIEQLSAPSVAEADKQVPKRQPLPANLPRREIRHEPPSTTCGCGCELKRIGEDVGEKLDYVPGVFSVERHIRGKWVCVKCETLIQAPVPAHVIDKGLPTAGLIAQVLVAKYVDHLPLHRQESVFARAGLTIARSTQAQWVGNMGTDFHPTRAARWIAGARAGPTYVVGRESATHIDLLADEPGATPNLEELGLPLTWYALLLQPEWVRSCIGTEQIADAFGASSALHPGSPKRAPPQATLTWITRRSCSLPMLACLDAAPLTLARSGIDRCGDRASGPALHGPLARHFERPDGAGWDQASRIALHRVDRLS